jgi:TrmH family RNA methyltransferase
MIQPYLEVIKDFELEKISSYTSANDVVAIFSQQEVKSPLSAENTVTLVLDDIRDPGNLGTIIRTADWFGIPQIICSNHTVDGKSGKSQCPLHFSDTLA